jgi:hypothetical protein
MASQTHPAPSILTAIPAEAHRHMMEYLGEKTFFPLVIEIRRDGKVGTLSCRLLPRSTYPAREQRNLLRG